MIIMATDSVDIFNNRIINNKSVGVATVSYYDRKTIERFDLWPICTAIYIHDNKFDRSGLSLTERVPDLSTDLGKLLSISFKGG